METPIAYYNTCTLDNGCMYSIELPKGHLHTCHIPCSLHGVHFQIKDVTLEPNPCYGVVAEAPTEPQLYEEIVPAVTSGGASVVENPAAYQVSWDIVTASQTEEPEYI